MNLTSFKNAKIYLIECLKNGNYLHAQRGGNICVKNKLLTGEISARELIEIIKKSNGSHHLCSPHHLDASINVHIIRTAGWYVKFYFVDPDTWFISVHQ